MSVLVGIVSKNRANVLPKAIESAMKQSCEGLSLKIYDDNSSDNTRQLERRFPSVAWEFGEKDRGLVYARNKFMLESTAVYFCSLDDDAWFVKPDILEKSVSYLSKNPEIAAVAFDILSPDRPGEVNEGPPVEVNSFIGCGHILRLDVARQAGLYEPLPGFYGGEEKDLCIRFINMGYKVMLLPGVHIWHDKTNVARDVAAQHRSGVCNDLVFCWRRTPLLFLLPAFLARIVAHLLFAVRYKKEDIVTPCIRGFRDFFSVMLSGKLKRQPVSIAAFRKFRRLVKI